MFKKLDENDVPRYQERGYFDEHIITLNAQVYGDPHIYEDKYLVYHDPTGKMLWLTLFPLKGDEKQVDGVECLRTSLEEFDPIRTRVASPKELSPVIGNHTCESTFSDKDYQIKLSEFDEDLRGGAYDCLRYRVHNATKRGYRLTVENEITPAHSYIMAFHISKRDYNMWDYQLFLRLQNYVKSSSTAKLFNVYLGDVLVGFDIVDFLDNTMATPLGFYLDYPSLSDFVMHREVVYAKERNFEWLDIGWACNSGLEQFKKKWKGIPRFNIYVQEYVNKSLLEKGGALGQVTLQAAAMPRIQSRT